MGRLENHFLDDESAAVQSMFAVTGFNFAGQGQNAGLAFIRLRDWEERDLGRNGVQALIGRAMGEVSGWRDAVGFALNPPAIPALGFASGFNFQLLDRGGRGHEALVSARDRLLAEANGDPALRQVRYNGLPDAPQFQLAIDREQASAYGVSLQDINDTLSIALGSSYVNDFLDRGRIKRVVVQGDVPYRMQPSDLEDWYLRNGEGAMVPYSAFASGEWAQGAQQLQRYNGVPAMNVQGNAAPGFSTGDAMAVLERLAARLGEGFTGAWTGLSYEERQAGGNAALLYGLSMLVVFLSLAALYESWSIPFAVMLVVPLGILGAVLAVTLRGLTNDVFFQVGLLTTVGLSAKNAILIAEFALALQQQGRPLLEATLEATRMRLRPIVMTSLAFMLGVTPLMLSSGAGSGARQALGTSVFGGMLSATVLAIFFVPLFFVLVRRLAGGRRAVTEAGTAEQPAG
jgi:multidrug efflux pump